MAGMSNGEMKEWARAPPPNLPFGRRLANFCYNPEDKSILGRTPKRWGIVVTFYLCFYAVLAALFAACMSGLMYNIDKSKPHFTLTESLIGSNPGVAHRPRDDVRGVVQYSSANLTYLVDEVQDFLKDYEKQPWFVVASGCKSSDLFGLPDNPCFYVKLNKIFDWVPQYFDGEKNTLPADMPGDLKNYINTLDAPQRQQIWMSCEEEKSNGTAIEYPWGRGLSSRHYPFLNQEGYRSPLLAVRVIAPAKNTLITIRCRMWAGNILYNKSLKEPRGYTRIQFYIEDTLSATTA